jgi:hypothetical protein
VREGSPGSCQLPVIIPAKCQAAEMHSSEVLALCKYRTETGAGSDARGSHAARTCDVMDRSVARMSASEVPARHCAFRFASIQAPLVRQMLVCPSVSSSAQADDPVVDSLWVPAFAGMTPDMPAAERKSPVSISRIN